MPTEAPGSSDSAMTTATRLVPRSRPTVFFRRDKTCAGTPPGTWGWVRAGCRDYIGSSSCATQDFVGGTQIRTSASDASLDGRLKGSTQHLMKSRQGCLEEGGVREARKVQAATEALDRARGSGVVEATGGR